jgi:hypothetical protein
VCACARARAQSATVRPTARYLQQHRFVVAQRPSSAACLLSLVQQVRVTHTPRRRAG